jgi:hypothetical protein
MSLSPESDFEEKFIKGELVKRKRAVIIDPLTDFLLSQIDVNLPDDELSIIFREYFERKPHNIFAGLEDNPPRGYAWPPDARDPTAVQKARDAMNCSGIIFTTTPPASDCPLPCSCITLSGNRRIKNYVKDKPPTLPPPSPPWENRPITILDPADQVWLHVLDKMGLFDMLSVLLNDFARGGRYSIPGDEIYGLIMQVMINQINSGMSSRVKQRTAAYLRSIGLERQRNEPDKSFEGMVLINRGFTKLLFRLLCLLLIFYRYRRVQDVIVGVVTHQPSSAAYAEITKTIDLFKLAMQPFYYGSNYSDTLKGIVWAQAALYVLRATRDKYGVPMSSERFDQIIPAAYSILVKTGQTTESNRWVLHKSAADNTRDFILSVSALQTDKLDNVKMFVTQEEDRVEAIRHAILQITGTIDLADQKWQREDAEFPQKW